MVAQVPDLLGSDAYTAPWVTNPPPPPDPMSPTPAPVPFGAKYEPAVERWRPGLMAEFAKQGVPTVDSRGNDLIDKSLHVLTYESHGDDTATGDGGHAYGGFQSHYIAPGTDMQGQIADAVGLIKRNPDMWTDWGEGSTYQGQPFGALGRVPYGSAPPTGSTLGGFFGNAIKSRATIPTTDSSYVPSDQPLSGQAGRPVGGFRDTETNTGNTSGADPFTQGVNAIGNGIKTGYDAAADFAASHGPASMQNLPGDSIIDPLDAATHPFEGKVGHFLGGAANKLGDLGARAGRDFARQPHATGSGVSTGDPSQGEAAGRTIGSSLVPRSPLDFVLLADQVPELIDAARPGIKALIKTGLPEAPGFGTAEFHAGVGGGSPFDAQQQLDAMAAEDAAKAEANKPKPGQGGLFGGVVDQGGKIAGSGGLERIGEAGKAIAGNFYERIWNDLQSGASMQSQAIPEQFAKAAHDRGAIKSVEDVQSAMTTAQRIADSAEGPARQQQLNQALRDLVDGKLTTPEMPAHPSAESLRPATEFRGESGGQQIPAFTREETGQTGQMDLAESLTPKPPEGIPDVAAEQAKPTPLPPANGLARDQRMVRAGDLQFRPDLFQARDTTEGLPYGEGRVKQIAENWNDAKFTPPDAVPDPENPGKFIVTSGHHRTEAFIRNFGEDAPIPTTITHADLNNPEHLSQMQSLARSANFDTAEANFREKVRVAQNAASPEAAAQELRLTPGKVEELHDAARVGKQAIDRVVSEPALQPYITEIGRGVRVHGITEEDANGLFNRIADGTKVSRPTPTALRETIDKFGAILGDARFKAAQGAGMFGDEAGGSKGGLLQLIDENARTRTQLTKDIAANRRAMSGAGKLAADGTAADKKAAERLVSLGSAKVKEAQAALARNEANLGRAARGEDLLPEPAPKAPARPKATTPETAPPASSGTAPAPPERAPPAAPPRTPPPRSAPLGEEPVDQLIAHVEAAASMKPDLAARRTEERAKRFDAMFQKLIAGGAEPSNAFKEARTELGGQLADPSFVVPGDLDHNALHQYIIDAVTRKEVPLMTGNAADEGLKKLAEGFVPANHEIRDLGQVFGPRLQQAIEDMGTILNVQSRVEASLLREPIQITFPDGTAITPEKLGDLLRERLPGTDKDMLGKVAERLIDEEKIKVAAGKGGKKVLTVGEAGSGDNIVRMGGSGFEDGVPHQEVPPVTPKLGEDSFQPSTALAPGPEHFLNGIPNRPPTAAERATNFAQHGLPKTDRAPLPPGVPEESRLAGAWRQIAAGINSPIRAVTFGHSDVLRNGLSYAVWHPAQARESLQDMWTVLLHPSTREALESEMNQMPFWKAAIDAGWVREEVPAANRLKPALVDRGFDRVPLMRNSAEARGVYQSSLRKLGYESDARWLHSRGVTDPEEYRALFDTVGDVTGHGLRGRSAAIGGVNTTFSPSAMLGRFRSLTDLVSPEMGIKPENGANFSAGGTLNPFTPGARGVAARNLIATGGIALSIEGLAKASGMNLNWNLLNTPLGKVQFGASTLDPTQGYSSVIKLAAQVIDALDRGDPTKVRDSLTAYLRGQLGPVSDTFVSTITGHDWQAKHFNLIDKTASGELLADLYTPIAAKAIMDAWKAHGPIGALFAAPSVGAMSVETNMVQTARDKAVAAMNQTDPTTGKPITTYADAGPILRHAVDQAPEVVKAQGGPSAYQEAKLASLKPALDERDRQEALHEQGKNTEKLADVYGSLNDKRQQSAHDLEPQFARTFANFSKDKYNKAIEDYYSNPKLIPEGEDNAGGLDFEATAADRQDKLAKMAPDVQEWVKQALAVTEGNKSPTEQKYDAMIAMKKQVGYFEDGADRKALDRQYPALDVASWKNNSTSTKASEMNSTAAVEMALADPYSKVLPVKFSGLAVPINQSKETEAAFKEYGKRAQNYEEGYVNDPRWKPIWDVERAKHSQETYGKPFAQLADWQKTKVTDWLKSETRTVSRDNAPDLDAYLAWAGNGSRTIAGNQAAVDALQALRKKYGKEVPSKDGKPLTFR